MRIKSDNITLHAIMDGYSLIDTGELTIAFKNPVPRNVWEGKYKTVLEELARVRSSMEPERTARKKRTRVRKPCAYCGRKYLRMAAHVRLKHQNDQ